MITFYFAKPGVGKSTLAARMAFWQHFKRRFGTQDYERVVANFPLKHTFLYRKEDIGVFDLTDGIYKDENGKQTDKKTLCILDEAGCEFNNRRFKEMTILQQEHFRKHRKYNEDWVIFSQSVDIDKVLRDLCPEMRYLKKCMFLPYTIKALRIVKFVDVDQEKHDIVDGFEFDPWFIRIFTTKRYYLPLYWDLFDSWDCPDLPHKDFKRYD